MLSNNISFGVGARADVLAAALGEGEPITIRRIAETTGYTSVSVRTALDDLARAGFIESAERRPASYLAPRKQWQSMLQLSQIPAWRPLQSLFVFTGELVTWAEAASARSVSDYAVTAHIQDLMREHSQLFDAAPSAPFRHVPADELPMRFAEYLANVLRWVDTNT